MAEDGSKDTSPESTHTSDAPDELQEQVVTDLDPALDGNVDEAAGEPQADQVLASPPRGVDDETAGRGADSVPNPAPDDENLRTRGVSGRLKRLRRVFVPLVTVGFTLGVLITFHTVLLPFIFALFLVYLMEPIVSGMSNPESQRRRLPRWAAVVLVYIGFLAIVTTSVVLVVPRFVTEIVRFAETTPEAIAEFRKDRLPGINSQLQDLLHSYLPGAAEMMDVSMAQEAVRKARVKATGVTAAMGQAQTHVAVASQVQIQWDLSGEPGRLERKYVGRVPQHVFEAAAIDEQSMQTGSWRFGETEASPPTFKIVADGQGGYDFFLTDQAIEVVETDEGSWEIRRPDAYGASNRKKEGVELSRIFDLERSFDEVVESLMSTSSARISSLVEYAQTLTLRLIQGFLAIVLTLMVAAFISIDLPRLKSFARDLVPPSNQPGYDELLGRMDRRLGGVVRGQLMICVVNGLLTYIGLAILGVKYSVLLAVIAAVLSIIPIFGAVLSTIPIVAIALTQSFTLGLLTLGWILTINFVEANFLNPKIIGTAAHIHPVIVIFALLAGQSAYGLVGAILAIPTASIVLTLFLFVRDRYARVDEIENAVSAQHDGSTA